MIERDKSKPRMLDESPAESSQTFGAPQWLVER